MIKPYLIVLCLALGALHTFGQSQTFQIENITKPVKPLPTVPSKDLFKGIDKDFVKFSVSEPILDYGTHPVIMGYLRAYQYH
ncbi:hypothetical protein ACXZ1K_13670 [Pedobacter sp. PWIIR3]